MLAAIVCAAGASVARAQAGGVAAGIDGSLSAGSGVIQRSGDIRRSALWAAGTAAWRSPSGIVAMHAAYAGGASGLAATSLGASVVLPWRFVPAITQLQAERVGSPFAAAPTTQSATLVQSLQYAVWRFAAVGARSQWQRAASVGWASRAGADVGFDGGAWAMAASAMRLRTNDWRLAEAEGHWLDAPAPAYDWVDVSLRAAWQADRWLVGAETTWRSPRGATVFATRGATLRLSRSVGGLFVAAVEAGRVLADPVRGVPGGAVGGASVHWTFGRSSTPRAFPSTTPLGLAAGTRSREYTVDRESSGDVWLALRVPAPASDSVWVATDINDWEPQRLLVQDEVASGRVLLRRGIVRVAIRIGSGAWRAPRGLPSVADAFGGTVGVLVVP